MLVLIAMLLLGNCAAQADEVGELPEDIDIEVDGDNKEVAEVAGCKHQSAAEVTLISTESKAKPGCKKKVAPVPPDTAGGGEGKVVNTVDGGSKDKNAEKGRYVVQEQNTAGRERQMRLALSIAADRNSNLMPSVMQMW
jgi:hypothetical protein